MLQHLLLSTITPFNVQYYNEKYAYFLHFFTYSPTSYAPVSFGDIELAFLSTYPLELYHSNRHTEKRTHTVTLLWRKLQQQVARSMSPMLLHRQRPVNQCTQKKMPLPAYTMYYQHDEYVLIFGTGH